MCVLVSLCVCVCVCVCVCLCICSNVRVWMGMTNHTVEAANINVLGKESLTLQSSLVFLNGAVDCSSVDHLLFMSPGFL